MEPILNLEVQVVGADFFTHALACIFDDFGWKRVQDLDGPFDGSSHLNVGPFFLLFRPLLAFMLGLITSTFFAAIHLCFAIGDMIRSKTPRLKDMLINSWSLRVLHVRMTLLVMKERKLLVSARRALLRTRRRWYPNVVDLHKFMVAVSRKEVNHIGNGSTSPDAMTW